MIEKRLAWVISAPLDAKQGHLFHNLIRTDYTIYAYSCLCGREDFLLTSCGEILDYYCPQCGNEIFHDANSAHKNIDYFLEKHGAIHKNKDRIRTWNRIEDEYFYDLSNLSLPLEFHYNVKAFENKIVSSYETICAIPKEIDFERSKIIKSPITLYSLTLFGDGTKKEEYHVPCDYVFMQKIMGNIDAYIREQESIFGISKPKDKFLTYHSVLFFLSFPWLKEYEFYLWDAVRHLPEEELTINEALVFMLKEKNHKSIRKAIFQNYTLQIQKYNSFQVFMIQAIIATIENTDFIVRLFDSDLHCSMLSVQEGLFISQLIDFLKTHYSEKQIVSLILKIKSDEQIILDIMRDFLFIGDDIEAVFKKTKCAWEAIHDEMVLCARKKYLNLNMNDKLYYLDSVQRATGVVNGYEIKLPHTRAELYDWSEKLHNCLSGYYNKIAKNHSTVYGFLINGEIEFAVEILDDMIIQARSAYNKPLTGAQTLVLNTWHDQLIKNRSEAEKRLFD